MRNNRGFTLVEVIISIGALGIICAVLLRLFVLAGDTNARTSDRQMAEMAAASASETLLCAGTLESGMEVMGAQPGEGGIYTADWQGYEVSLRATASGGDYPGALYEICVQAFHDGTLLAEIHTAKYYPEEKG
jgi:prepilin-type N-terminal cleavage/methylation domain-containing protein